MAVEGEWLGTWWRPDSGSRVGGRLEIADRGGIRLALFGSLADWSEHDLSKGVGFPLKEALQIPVVHGWSGKSMSVLGASTNFPHPPGVLGTEGWSAQAIVEAHVKPTDDEPTFGGIRVELDTLPAWSRARNVAARYYFSGRTDVVAKPHALAHSLLPDGTEVRIHQHSIVDPGDSVFTIRQPVTVSFEGGDPSTWRELLNKWIQPMQVLLWIATARTSAIREPEVLISQSDDEPERWARLWAPLIDDGTNSSATRDGDVLFRSQELPGGFAPGLQRWLDAWTNLRHVLGPLYARASAPFAYANDRFYTAAAAIEAYHRYCVTSERDLPKAEHKHRVARVDEVLATHAPELRNWAVNAVTPFNRIPLWRRIVQIAETLPEMTTALFGDRLEPFARAVEDGRHGHAHALDRTTSISDGSSLYFVADALVWMLRTCLLVDLGFRPEVAQDRVMQHERFSSTAERLVPVLDELS